jgi:hypothetical protein
MDWIRSFAAGRRLLPSHRSHPVHPAHPLESIPAGSSFVPSGGHHGQRVSDGLCMAWFGEARLPSSSGHIAIDHTGTITQSSAGL